jgi:hypothetical protein
LSEHHLQAEELENINLGQYIRTFGALYCRLFNKQGGVSIYVSRDIQFHPINIKYVNEENDLEICALKIDLQQTNFIINFIYRSQLGRSMECD